MSETTPTPRPDEGADQNATEAELIALLDAYRKHWKRTEDHILVLLRDLRDPVAKLRNDELAAVHRKA
ncbi:MULTISPECIES: hypothetical protein [Streptosporangiaceae]|uniref:hypothetical protein n=1 Tax=Streptosporangiaceae TaxID=2004 RepID=UPI0033D074C3